MKLLSFFLFLLGGGAGRREGVQGCYLDKTSGPAGLGKEWWVSTLATASTTATATTAKHKGLWVQTLMGHGL